MHKEDGSEEGYQAAWRALETFFDNTPPAYFGLERFLYLVRKGDIRSKKKIQETFYHLSRVQGYEELHMFSTQEGIEYLISYARRRFPPKGYQDR